MFFSAVYSKEQKYKKSTTHVIHYFDKECPDIKQIQAKERDFSHTFLIHLQK